MVANLQTAQHKPILDVLCGAALRVDAVCLSPNAIFSKNKHFRLTINKLWVFRRTYFWTPKI